MNKEKNSTEDKQRYVRPVDRKRYVSEIKYATPTERKYLYKAQQKREGEYQTQQAKIKLGLMPSRVGYEASRVAEKIEGRTYSALKRKAVSRSIIKPEKRLVIRLR